MNLPVCPRSLLRQDRLDIAIKWRFFRHLIEGNDPDAERVYRCHVHGRTGGIEPGSWKRSLDDYVKACRDLLASMQANGFDPKQPIKLDKDRKQLNGAHRLACALALGLDVSVTMADRKKTGAPWAETELTKAGLSQADIRRVREDWARL